MPILHFDWTDMPRLAEFWLAHHKLRHRVFVERLKWPLSHSNGLEFDVFDNAAARYLVYIDRDRQVHGVARLIPTTTSYMTQTLWPNLIEGQLPCTPGIWEVSRFAVDPDLPRSSKLDVTRQLIRGCLEVAAEWGAHTLVAVIDRPAFAALLVRAGCRITSLGPTLNHPTGEIRAIALETSARLKAAPREHQHFSVHRADMLPSSGFYPDCNSTTVPQGSSK